MSIKVHMVALAGYGRLVEEALDWSTGVVIMGPRILGPRNW